MTVTSYLRVGDKIQKLDELTADERADLPYKLHMQMLKSLGVCMPSQAWFNEHPEHREYWDKIVAV